MRHTRVPRYGRTTRWFHWSFAGSFLALAFSGAALLARDALGLHATGAQRVLRVHELAGVLLLTVPWLIGISGDRRAWLADLSEAARLRRDDAVWLLRQPLAWLGKAELPAQDKLNAGQKLNALAVAGITGTMAVTGIHLWLEPGAFLALLLHLAGFLAWLPAIGVHLFMVLVNPATRPALRGMVRGDVDRAWARHHHARWLEQQPPEERVP